ncbi:carbohydrate-binding protein [Opitutus terrae]|uniref:Carbohydrate binding family 6 n=1 Tax=Opitutus terrae (strain DSM 11246 / JCM 15787 / PB90-1) TaxID=452637 RepID=B1ZQQ5_OPITP|nr:carbohydrate-binding protein [Opitutus terrae]ACB77806.1 Carbohydrate binding family 6 [Opitutus terrae PB90-1]
MPPLARLVVLALVCTFALAPAFARPVHLAFDPQDEPVGFAARELESALIRRGFEPHRLDLTASLLPSDADAIVLASADSPLVRAAVAAQAIAPPGDLRAEGFSLRIARHEPRRTWIIAPDSAGLMYGGLETAELIRTRGLEAITDRDSNPHFAERGVKFNLPLDARTPSYTDASDSAQQNIATVWDLGFWHDFIDRLARDRYNLISLWNLHPFPSLVRVPEYPDVALADVQRSTAKWDEFYSTWAVGLDAPEILDHVETLKRMTIEEKIAFWREVMRYGRSRNVKFYLITWNVFLNGTGAGARPPSAAPDSGVSPASRYGFTTALDNAATIDYFRRSVRELLLTYPDLAGIGLTTGENMLDATPAQKEQWAFRTYGQGVLDALAVQPDRRITFIHRQHEAAAREIAQTFAPLIAHQGVDFVYSFKYAEAHALSSTRQNFHERFLADIGDQPVLWTLRNDDAYVFRWGAPDFVREFIQNMPGTPTRGFYYGSDQWIWGREFLDVNRASDAPRPLEIEKHWYHWLLWGRLGYDPALPNERLIALLAEQFPSVDAAKLFAAWQDASMIYPLTTGFHWGRFDFQWYIEAARSRPEPAQTPTGFHDINRFISLPPHPTTGNVSIPDYVDAITHGREIGGITPLQVADQLNAHAARALALVDEISAIGDSTLQVTLDDIRSMAHLGGYYAHKIRAATELALSRAKPTPDQHATIARELNQAAFHWRNFASLALAHYRNPIWMNRVGTVDWRALYRSVLYDLTITGSPVAVPSMSVTPGGSILEAEDARVDSAPVRRAVAGFTGVGYRDFAGSQGRRWIEWTYDAPTAGHYLLEFRYAMRRDEIEPAALILNGAPAGAVVLWPTGSLESWAWDRVIVNLHAGPNTIRLNPPLGPNIDHLNILCLR